MAFGLVGRLVGAGVFGLGLLIVVGFPSVMYRDFQPEGISRAGVIFGIILMGIGLYLILG
jgi:hypothetical protein